MTRKKAKLAVWKFASCDGCQLSLLDCEDEFLRLMDFIEIAHFPEASSEKQAGPYDISLVEGSISTSEHFDLIKRIRKDSKFLIAIGACATSGGVQALRNYKNHEEFLNYVYATPKYIDSLEKSEPISSIVPVDFELRGCPIDKNQLLELINAYLNERKPNIQNESVCLECKMSGQVCVMVAHGTPCLGPITHAGCGALCPGYNRGCFGCYGPQTLVNKSSLVNHFKKEFVSDDEVKFLFENVNSGDERFRK